jgi:hypothetical protein
MRAGARVSSFAPRRLAYAILLITLGASGSQGILASYVSVLGLTLEKSTLEEAQGRFKSGSIVHNGGDAAASVTLLCYVGPDGTSLVLTSSEIEGGTYINGYQLLANRALADFGASDTGYRVPATFDPKCASLAKVKRSLRIGALGLGMTREEVVQVLGRPSKAQGSTLVYVEQTTVTIRGTKFDLLRYLSIEFQDKRSVAVSMSQVTSS